MTTVSMDNTTTEKFFLASFVWCVFPINSAPAYDRPHLRCPRLQAGARHGDSWTR
ncbi:hypothetical protein [Mycobacterium sp.]|uniref:hypothetical protein n=1 Tax=Mycobacterium sp. TaxID=1785 RepID=UPI0025F4CCB4|nr:hypothetical protein [Mycobacterium sp.]